MAGLFVDESGNAQSFFVEMKLQFYLRFCRLSNCHTQKLNLSNERIVFRRTSFRVSKSDQLSVRPANKVKIGKQGGEQPLPFKNKR